jgi:hypothetical protein
MIANPIVAVTSELVTKEKCGYLGIRGEELETKLSLILL